MRKVIVRIGGLVAASVTLLPGGVRDLSAACRESRQSGIARILDIG